MIEGVLLDKKEGELLNQHPLRVAEYLVKAPAVPHMAILSASEHHMCFDPLGYPSVGKDWQLSLVSQITAISETYDDLHTNRSYRAPLSVEKVLDNISKMKGTQFHPLLVDDFMCLMRQVTLNINLRIYHSNKGNTSFQ